MIQKVQFITTNAQLAEEACKGGVRWIQLRLKNTDYDTYKAEALKVQQVCKNYNAVFIVNDNVQLALSIKADGVHIGKQDMPAAEARKILGDDFIIGCTANTADEVIDLSGGTADYIGLGPYRFTSTKENLSPVLGLDGYERIFDRLRERSIPYPPVIGIGGITVTDIPDLMKTGLYGVAVSGAIAKSGEVRAAARDFVLLAGADAL